MTFWKAYFQILVNSSVIILFNSSVVGVFKISPQVKIGHSKARRSCRPRKVTQLEINFPLNVLCRSYQLTLDMWHFNPYLCVRWSPFFLDGYGNKQNWFSWFSCDCVMWHDNAWNNRAMFFLKMKTEIVLGELVNSIKK